MRYDTQIPHRTVRALAWLFVAATFIATDVYYATIRETSYVWRSRFSPEPDSRFHLVLLAMATLGTAAALSLAIAVWHTWKGWHAYVKSTERGDAR